MGAVKAVIIGTQGLRVHLLQLAAGLAVRARAHLVNGKGHGAPGRVLHIHIGPVRPGQLHKICPNGSVVGSLIHLHLAPIVLHGLVPVQIVPFRAD